MVPTAPVVARLPTFIGLLRTPSEWYDASESEPPITEQGIIAAEQAGTTEREANDAAAAVVPLLAAAAQAHEAAAAAEARAATAPLRSWLSQHVGGSPGLLGFVEHYCSTHGITTLAQLAGVAGDALGDAARDMGFEEDEVAAISYLAASARAASAP